jgi:hypothetical protein
MTLNEPQQPVVPNPYVAAAPYGAPYGGAAPARTGLSITSMVLGIVSILLAFAGMGLLTAIAGAIIGHVAQKKEGVAGRGFWLTGLITNYVALGISVITLIVLIVLFGGIFLFAVSSSPSTFS